MGFMFFIATIVFFVLWIKARTDLKNSDSANANFSEYGQGYWDGYRAFGEKAQQLIDQPESNVTEGLQELISAGEQGAAETQVAPEAYISQESDYQPAYGEVDEPVDEEVLTKYSEAQKEQETLRNLNVLLYVASFLIVAAAALFVTLVMPAGIKLFSLIFVTLAFYVTGLVLHARSTRLQPAAIAFVGTGLAILPFIGFALTSLGGMSGEVAWLVTSLVGLGAYGLAAVRLQSEFISYLTMAFMLSLALSTVSALSLSIVWYFIVVIGVSLICNLVAILWPQILPRTFIIPLDQTSRYTTPVALAASLFMAGRMDIFMYEVLYGLATAHYLVIWLIRRAWVYELIVRATAHITLLIVAADLTGLGVGVSSDSRLYFGVWVVILATVQAVYSIERARRSAAVEEVGQVERVLLAGAFVSMGCAQALWLGSEFIYEMTAINLTLIGIIALTATLRLREATWTYIGLGVSVLLPFVVLRGIIEPAVEYEVIAGGFAVLAVLGLVGLDRAIATARSQSVRSSLSVTVGVYATLVAVAGLLSADGTSMTWTALLAGALYIGLSYLLRTPALEVVGAVFGIGAVTIGVRELQIPQDWDVLLTSVISSAALALGAVLHYFSTEHLRRNSLVVMAAGMLSLLVFTAGGTTLSIQALAVILLLLAAMAGSGGRAMMSTQEELFVQVGRFASFVYPFLALLVAWQMSAGWVALVFAVVTGILWMSSYREKLPGLMIVGNMALVSLLITLWLWLEFDVSWLVFGVAWLASAVYYALYWLAFDKKDSYRQWIALGSIWVALGGAALVYVWSSEVQYVMAAAGSLLAAAALLGVQGYLDKNQTYIETAVYIVTFAAQRITEVLLPETNMVVYGHWWAAVIGVVAWWRSADRQLRAIVALSLVTGSTGIYALMSEPGYPLVFLIEHLIILTVGAVCRASWVMWWGLVSTIVAVLYFLRDYTFLAPLFLGVLLIIFVVWRLIRMGDGKDAN